VSDAPGIWEASETACLRTNGDLVVVTESVPMRVPLGVVNGRAVDEDDRWALVPALVVRLDIVCLDGELMLSYVLSGNKVLSGAVLFKCVQRCWHKHPHRA